MLTEKNRRLYQQIQERELAETEKREKLQEQPTESLTQSELLYRRLCELMEDPEVYTDPEANHETLAHALGTNRTYLGDSLRECAGTTPTDFINRYRIRHAALLLSTTDDPVALVAEQCGITNRSTFARLFRDHYSMTPPSTARPPNNIFYHKHTPSPEHPTRCSGVFYATKQSLQLAIIE